MFLLWWLFPCVCVAMMDVLPCVFVLHTHAHIHTHARARARAHPPPTHLSLHTHTTHTLHTHTHIHTPNTQKLHTHTHTHTPAVDYHRVTRPWVGSLYQVQENPDRGRLDPRLRPHGARDVRHFLPVIRVLIRFLTESSTTG